MYNHLHHILLNLWDPIGIKEIPEAVDEYDSYIPQIYKLLFEKKPLEEVYNYLKWVETVHMGLNGDTDAHNLDIARRLYELINFKK